MSDPRGVPVRTDPPLPGDVLSSHREKDDAWSAFFEAIEEPSADIIVLRDTVPAQTILAPSKEAPREDGGFRSLSEPQPEGAVSKRRWDASCEANRGSTRRVPADTARHSSCAASTDTARLISERAVSHHSTAVHGKREQMNKHELVSHVAAGTPVTRADAERLVGVVFSAIADALACGEPVTSGASGSSPHAAAQPEPAAIPQPVSRSPSRPRGRRRSSPRRPFAPRSTNSRVESTPEPAIQPATSTAAAQRAGFDSRSADAGTLVAERGRGDFHDFDTRANRCAAARRA